MNYLWIIISFTLVSNSLQIQNQLRRPVRFIEENDYLPINNNNIKKFDWEPALRASTLQALLREHVDDTNLRFRIYSAPLIGKQETATPFGDVAILARGQLFANYAGFLFIQDPYQNDCDDCHNRNRGECVHGQCNIWSSYNDKQLIALWSIKRIRHHTVSERHNQLEIIFSISPVSLSHPLQNYLTREGKFNYNIPGHVFVLKTTEYLSKNNFQPKFKNEAYFAAPPSDSRRFKFHDIPGTFTSATYLPPKTFSESLASESTEESAKKLYEQLIEHINKKTSTESHRNTPESAKSSTTTIPASTLVQFADGQILPITEIQSPYVTKSITGFVTVKFPETTSLPQHTTEEILKLHQVPEPSSLSTPAAAFTQEFLSTTTKIRPQSYGTFSTRLKQTSTPTTSKTKFIPIIPITTHFYPQQTKPFYQTKPITEEPNYVISKIPLPPNITTTIFYAEESPSSSTLENVQNIEQDHDGRTPPQPTTNPNKFTIDEFLYPTPTVNTITTDGQHHQTITDYYYHPNSEIPAVPTTKASFSITNPPITVYDDAEDFNQTPSSEENASTTKFTHPTTSFFYSSDTPLTTNSQQEPDADTTLVTQQRIPTNGKYTVKTTALPATTSEFSTDDNFHYSTRYSENSEETSSFSSTPTTLTQFETATSPPQLSTTNIAGFLKTTTVRAEQELFGVAKSITRPFKTTQSLRASSTEPSDFLEEDSVDSNNNDKKPLYKNSAKDYNNEELFGTTKVSVNSNTSSKKPKTTIKYNKSNVELALFDNFDKTKRRRSTTTPSSAFNDGMEKDLFDITTPVTIRGTSFTTKISTSSTKTSTKFNRKIRKSGPRQNPKLHQINVTATSSSTSKEFLVPVTSQSVATSISYEVNKKRKSSSASHNEKKRKIERNQNEIIRSNKNYNNDFALRLLNEAKSIEYLANNSSNKTTNRPKYVQRLNYIPNKVNKINKINKNGKDNK